ncbi:hypothetical protein [Caulobacter sp. CCUG 60055]|uniref:hypothetical protein n=1 Tax=Caulobacter sp. CCUG 60055 TaxID=2100090 RepID=UPI001FA75228|nr:hypothetical protein [Caulobacter sp. CCUG 60055]MBQ1541331.1 hypothetical protein [Caulobacteraceae bacterium]
MGARLTVVHGVNAVEESAAVRIQRLQLEAHALAREQIEVLEAAIIDLAAQAEAVASGGDAYPVGARELARRLALELPSKADTLKIILARD